MQNLTALEGFKRRSGMGLAGHPFAIKVDAYNTIGFINATLREQAEAFIGEDRKAMKCLKRLVHVLHPALSTSGVFGKAFGLVRRIWPA
jgi:hypothetical protein